MKKAVEPWKRKENRLSDRAAKNQALNIIDRKQMEESTKAPYRLYPLSWKIRFKTTDMFHVVLKHPLSVEEIEIRMNQAFGDL